MTPEEIANHCALVIEAMRNESMKYRKSCQFTADRLLDPAVIAAAITAYFETNEPSYE